MRSRNRENEDELQKPSRTKRKKAAKAAQRTGEALVALNDEQLGEMDIPTELHEAIVAVRQMHQHGARRRQMQYIGALMRTVDVQVLQQNIEKVNTQRHEEARRFRQVEIWRDELASGDEDRLAWIIENIPGADRGQLDKMINAVTGAKGTPERRKNNRALFRYLRSLME